MATTGTGDFEVAGKVDGDTISAADAGSLSAWDSVANAPKYSSVAAHGSLGMHALAAGAVKWAEGGASAIPAGAGPADMYARVNYRKHVAGSNIKLGIDHNVLGGDVQIFIGADNKLRVTDRAGSTIITTTAAPAADAWHRLEWHIVCSTTVGSLVFRVYDGVDDSAFAEEVTVTNQDLGTRVAEFTVGIIGFDATNDVYYDDIAIQYGAGATWLGPVVTSSPGRSTGMLLGVM